MPSFWIDRSIGRFRKGAESGVVETKMTIRNVIEPTGQPAEAEARRVQLYEP